MPSWLSGRRRIIAAAATLVAFGGIVTVTQVSNASTTKTQNKAALAACDNIATPPTTKAKLSTQTRRDTYTTNNGTVTQHPDDGAGETVTAAELRASCRAWVVKNAGGKKGGKGNGGAAATSAATTAPADGTATTAPADGTATTAPADNGNNGGNNNGGGTAGAPGPAGPALGGSDAGKIVNGQAILTDTCADSKLQLFDGFQNGNRCVSTQFGEVAAAANDASLLITSAPRSVKVNTPFTLQVSTRNLIRDRFLAAGKGGYYVESAVLSNGITRGHFHSACRMLANTNEAPTPEGVPAFFVATEDTKGGAAPDTVTIQVPGLPTAGTAQCASWAGDGSHRIPMMERANQTPAFDAVRIQVR